MKRILICTHDISLLLLFFFSCTLYLSRSTFLFPFSLSFFSTKEYLLLASRNFDVSHIQTGCICGILRGQEKSQHTQTNKYVKESKKQSNREKKWRQRISIRKYQQQKHTHTQKYQKDTHIQIFRNETNTKRLLSAFFSDIHHYAI